MKYTPQITLRELWYLFQFNPVITSESNLNAKEKFIYYCIFFDKHPDDQVKSDEFSRLWPECYTYTKIK